MTEGNASGVNYGTAALILAAEAAAKTHGLTTIVRVLGGAAAGIPPRVVGMGPAPASHKILDWRGLTSDELSVIELNEAFANRGLAALRQLGIADDDPRINRNGGAIALGRTLGMSDARITGTAVPDFEPGQISFSAIRARVGQRIAIANPRCS